jgi:hypothetical protein
MSVLFQWIKSLFTTAGSVNPIAILLLAGVSIYAYNDVMFRLDQRELARQCEVHRNAAQDKIDNLNRSNDNVTETIQSIDPDNLNDWVDRINRMQRKAD